MTARLKTFVTSDGLTEYVVATTSRPKALDAWGVNQDLFKEGRARETDDAVLVEAAAARPGEVVTRPVGGRLPQAPRAPRRKARPAGPTPAQKRRIAGLERSLQALEADLQEALDTIALKRKALEAREDVERRNYDRRKAELQRRLSEARRG